MLNFKLAKPYVRIYQVDDFSQPFENHISIYQDSPDTLTVAIRVQNPITTKGKDRNMVAIATVTLTECRQLKEFLENYMLPKKENNNA